MDGTYSHASFTTVAAGASTLAAEWVHAEGARASPAMENCAPPHWVFQ